MDAQGRTRAYKGVQGRTRAYKGARGHTVHRVMGAHGRDKLNHKVYEQIEHVVSLHKSPHLCKKLPETLDIITQTWYNKYVAKGAPQI